MDLPERNLGSDLRRFEVQDPYDRGGRRTNMPGIVGLVTRQPRESAERDLRRMLKALSHERFYVGGTWADETLGVYIGWVSRQGSFAECMPVKNEQGNIVLVLSGEEFPEPATMEWLKGRGHELDSTGPSYLVHWYEDDPTFPSRLNGRFHGVVADQTRKSVVLFNDRYGMQRLYWHKSDKAFYFAAEAKAILAVCPGVKRLNPRALGEYITCGCTLQNRCLFEGIEILPGGSKWTFQNGTVAKKEKYFDVKEWEHQDRLTPEAYYREVQDVFSRNLPRYFLGRETLGMSLTGGLDTRMIMAWQPKAPGSLPCYTFGGMLRDCEDVVVAREVAHVCGQSHEVIRVESEFLSRFPEFVERAIYLTDGCVDASRAPDLYLNERARQIAPIRMTGNYGGEVLRGVRAFKPVVPMQGLFDGEILPYVVQTQQTYGELVNEHPVSFAAFIQGPWHHYGILALEETQISMRSPFLDNDFIRTVFRAPEAALTTAEASLRLIAAGNIALKDIRTDRGVCGSRGPFSRAVSRTLLEFLFKAEYAYDMGMPQWLARVDHLCSGLHPERVFLGRHKIFHFRVWYRDVLAGYLREMLLDSRSLSRSYLNRKAVETVVHGHLKGKRNYTAELHTILTLELVHRLFVDSN